MLKTKIHEQFDDFLLSGLQELKLDCDADTRECLLNYIELLTKWNKVFNLTAVRDPKQMIVRHIFDSLAILPYLQDDNVLDVGTGAGIPGMILAIVDKDRAYTLLDSRKKKTRFLHQAVIELGLQNVTVANERIEDHSKEGFYGTIVSRAFSDFNEFKQNTERLMHADGILLAMKGRNIEEDLKNVLEKDSVEIIKTHAPFLAEKRQLLVYKNRRE